MFFSHRHYCRQILSANDTTGRKMRVDRTRRQVTLNKPLIHNLLKVAGEPPIGSAHDLQCIRNKAKGTLHQRTSARTRRRTRP